MSHRLPPNIYVAVYLLLIQNHQILLQRRFQTGWQDGNYSLVSGHVDGKETIKYDMIRESKEEIGIDLKEKDLQVINVMHTNTDREYLNFFILADQYEGKIQNLELEKCDDLAWFDLDKLPENTIEIVRRAINNYRTGEFFDSWNW
ncbi:MAG TPA: NUDIX domain-containing protein [Candidatus Gracilibacteria bacterium]|nr:NUDIX domain-containing protein [Candidatus Gracilibacteria bacterium]